MIHNIYTYIYIYTEREREMYYQVLRQLRKHGHLDQAADIRVNTITYELVVYMLSLLLIMFINVTTSTVIIKILTTSITIANYMY